MRKRKWQMSVIPATMICVYLAAIFYINFAQMPSAYITDMYTDILVAVRMWEQKTFFPSNWIFGNQLYVAATPAVAALLYGICGNAVDAMSAASCVMTVGVLLSFDYMVKAAFPAGRERLFGAAAFLAIVLAFGDAIWAENGWQLLFTMCSYYACYAINAFLAFGCYLRCRSGKRLSWLTVAAVCVLSFAVGIQSLRQTAVMALPLVVLALWQLLRRKPGPLPGRTLTVAGAIFASNIGGNIARNFLNVRQEVFFGEIALTKGRDIPAAAWNSLKVALALFGENDPSPLRMELLALFLILAAVLLWRGRREMGEDAKSLLALLLLGALGVAGADTVTTMPVREIYYFMLYPLLACLAVYVFSNRQMVLKGAMLALLCAVFCTSFRADVLEPCRWARDGKYEIYHTISDDLRRGGYTTVYSGWNGGEKIAIAAMEDGEELRAGFWEYADTPFVPARYLCDTDLFEADPRHTAYVFFGAEETAYCKAAAAKRGIQLTLLLEYPDSDIYLYTAPVNLMEAFGADRP